MLVPGGPTGLRLTIYDPFGAPLILDASADLAGGDTTWEDTPSGCGAAQLTIGMLDTQAWSAGYYTARNIVEISSGDDCVQFTIVPGGNATKIYVGSRLGYDTAVGHDSGQIALWDGVTLTMCIPVIGVGTDGGGDYLVVGKPLAKFTNPTTIAAYTPGTIIYRRRYTGIIMGRQLQSSRDPTTIIRCAGLSQRISEVTCTFALTTSTVDMGTAILNLLLNFTDNIPELVISPTNFTTTGQTTFTGSYQSVQMASVVSDLISAANSAGDVWVLRIGHDWTPRLVHVFYAANSYPYNVTLHQGVTFFEAQHFTTTDEDCSQLYNTIQVTGDTDPVTQQPVAAIVQDIESIAFYGQIDAQPVTNTACKTVAQCSLYGQSLLNDYASPRSNGQVVVATRNSVSVTGAPLGLSRGDCVLGVMCLTVTAIAPMPNFYGLVVSAVTAVSPGADTVQQIRFSAVEPNWNDNVKERANALATSLLQNINTRAGHDQYIVAAGAFAYTISGLTVTAPTFGAIFEIGSLPVSCGGSFTLSPNKTTWVWLNSSGGWDTQTSLSAQPGEILYAIFTTNAVTVIGTINKAATGIIEIPISALPSMGNQQSPILSNVSPVTYPVVGNGTYDAEVSFTVDVVGAPWLVGLALFALRAGSTEDPHFYPKGRLSSYGIVAGNWVCIWKGFGAGNVEDLYVAYEDSQGRFSGAVYVATTIANPAGTTAFGAVGFAAPHPIQPFNPFLYVVNGGGTYDADFVVYLDGNGTTANNALAEIEVVIAPASRGLVAGDLGWTAVGQPLAKNNSGVYDCTAGGMGVQVPYSVGIRYVGHDGDRSSVYVVGNTTAAQLAQVPFVGAVVDPNTGYIITTGDNAIGMTALQYSLPSAGVGSMVSAAWNSKVNDVATRVGVGLFWTANVSAYLAQWEQNGSVTIQKLAGTVWTIKSTSVAIYPRDATKFHNIEFVASMVTSGTVNLTAILDGQIATKFADSTAPITAGNISYWFHGSTASNYIDEKTIAINFAGSPSSSGFKAQANIIPASIPGCAIGVSSPTCATLGLPGGLQRFGGKIVTINSGTLLFSDGSTMPFTSTTLLNVSTGGADGVWYFSLGLIPATGAGVYYLSQSAPTDAQLSAFYADGVIPVAFNLSFTVVAAGAMVYGASQHIRRPLS